MNLPSCISLPLVSVDVNLLFRLRHEAIVLLNLALAFSWLQSELLEKDCRDDGHLKVGEEVARALSATGDTEWTEFQTTTSVGTAWDKTIWVKSGGWKGDGLSVQNPHG